MRNKNLTILLTLVMVIAMVLVACKPEEVVTEEPVAEEETATEEAVEEEAEEAEVEEAEEAEVEEETVELEEQTSAEDEAEEGLVFTDPPMLADKVASGELPPAEERIPTNPFVIPTTDAGAYGGTLYILDGQTRLSLPHRITDHGLFGYNMEVTTYHPDIAQGYSWNDDYTELTITLRPGMKWSDGDDFTTEDFQWYWDNVLFNEELSPNGPGGNWQKEGEFATLEVIDETTLVYTWPIPNPGIMDAWGRSSFSSPGGFFGPSHFYATYHADFTDRDELNQMAIDNGYEASETAEAWVAQFVAMKGHPYNGVSWNMDLPSLRPWNPIEITAEYMLLERNPYFYMVDEVGNQLPYFDYLRVDAVGDMEVYNLKVSAGESDLALWFPSFDNMELYRGGEEEGGYTTYIADGLDPCKPAVFFNQTVEDETKRALWQTLEFRQALSLATGRADINDVLFFGLGEASASAPGKGMPWYDESFMNEFVDPANYDAERANAMLDELGLAERDGEGYRLMADGERLSITMSYSTGDNQASLTCEMLVTDWQDVGVEVICSALDPTAHGESSQNNELEGVIWNLGRGTLFGRGTPDNWSFYNNSANYWAGAWIDWFNDQAAIEAGADPADFADSIAIEPPQEIKDQFDAWKEFSKYPSDSEEAATLGKEYYSFLADNMFFFCAGPTPVFPVIVRDDIGNFPPAGVDTITFGSDHNMFHPYFLEAWYRK